MKRKIVEKDYLLLNENKFKSEFKKLKKDKSNIDDKLKKNWKKTVAHEKGDFVNTDVGKKSKIHSRVNKLEIPMKAKQKLENKKESEDSRHFDRTTSRKTIRFQETVEVNVEGSNEKKEMKLKEDNTNNAAIGDMITEINSFRKGKKKEKSKKEKKLDKQNEDSKLVQQQCIEYLKKWKNDKLNWKFEKAKQIRLINNMFDSLKLPEEVFPVFLEYISGSKGNITKVIGQKCSVVVKEMEDFMEIDEEKQNEATKPDKTKYERARSILQVVEDFNL